MDASDWLMRLCCPWRTLMIGCFACDCFSRLLLASQPREVRHAKCLTKKTITRRCLLCGDDYTTIRRSDLSLTSKQVQTNVTLVCYLLYPLWSFETVHYALLYEILSTSNHNITTSTHQYYTSYKNTYRALYIRA